MKTTKEQQGLIRKMATELNEKNPGPAWHIMLELLDDLDTLETRLSEATALLERARPFVTYADRATFSEGSPIRWMTDLNHFIADLERFTKGLE